MVHLIYRVRFRYYSIRTEHPEKEIILQRLFKEVVISIACKMHVVEQLA